MINPKRLLVFWGLAMVFCIAVLFIISQGVLNQDPALETGTSREAESRKEGASTHSLGNKGKNE